MMLEDTDFDFVWKNWTLADGAEIDGARITNVKDLRKRVWEMVGDSVLVTVEWEEWAQVGWLRNITVPITIPGEYRVTVEVSWVKQNEQEQRRRPKPAVNMDATVMSLSDGWSTALRQIRRPLTLADEAQQRAESSVVKINDQIRAMNQTRTQLRDSAISTMGASGRMAEAMASVASEGATLRTVAGEQPIDVMPLDEPGSRIVYDHYRAALGRAAGGVRWQAAFERRRLLSEARPDVLGRHTALQDEDLRLLAFRTYGRVDAWQDIARFNDLTGSVLRQGQAVLLPRLA
jgi:hypothetical protein